MRVLLATKKYPPLLGGDATAVAALRKVEEKAGIEVEVLTPAAARGDDADVRVHAVGPPARTDALDRVTWTRIASLRAMRRWAQTHLGASRPDVLHAHAPEVAAAVGRPARDLGIPIVLTCHGVWFPSRSRLSPTALIERAILRRNAFAFVTVVDRPSADSLRSIGVEALVVPNGVDRSEFSGPRIEHASFRFLCVARHERQKGLDVLLEATRLLAGRTSRPFTVRLVGEGSETGSLKRRARTAGGGSQIEFLGSLDRPNLVREYRAADAFVLPSRAEGFPLVILEAWAAEVPVIATSVGGIPDVCTSENTVLVPPEDPRALAGAMGAWLEDPESRDRLARAGRTLVDASYDWNEIVKRYEEIYERTVGVRR